MSRASQRKGRQGQREWIRFLEEKAGVRFWHTPLSGGLAGFSGDVRPVFGENAGVFGSFHFEVKRAEKLSLPAAIQQARYDAGSKTWVVAHRSNRTSWKVTMEAADWVCLMAELNELREKIKTK